MSGYAKLFSRILDSTIWREDDSARILWITMLALADRDGIVYCTVPGLADRARITLPECESALERFQQPDKYSWSKEEEGRRIRVVDGGWFLINHAKYRALMSADEQREKNRIRVERHRAKKKSLHTITGVTINECNDIAEADTDTNLTPPISPPPSRGNVTLTVRDRRKLNDVIYAMMDQHQEWPLEQAMETACAQLMIPLESARSAVSEAGMQDALKRRKTR